MKKLEAFFEWFADVFTFLVDFFKYLISAPIEWRELLKQMDEIGSKSLALVGTSGFAIGVVLALQMDVILTRFGAKAYMPTVISLSVIKELGPVITALVVSGRVAAGMGAELGSMRVTEQIDAIDIGAVNSFNYLVVPRILACILCLPLLTIFCDIIAVAGGFLGSYLQSGTLLSQYVQGALGSLTLSDVIAGVFKTTIFGLIIGLIGCYKGYNATGGTAGVGTAATTAVVIASLTNILADIVLVKLSLILLGA